MKIALALLVSTALAAPALAAVPNEEDFVVIETFPEPAAGAFTVVGVALNNGRFLLWNGDAVFVQDTVGGPFFNEIATGYVGDPAFVALAPNGATILLGAGFGDGVTANLYRLNWTSPVDFQPGSEIPAPSQFSGVFLNSNLVAIDRLRADGTRAEVVVFDLSAAKSNPYFASVLERPAGQALRALIDKPTMSFSSTINTNPLRQTLYVMDANTRELRSFSVAAVIDAFEMGTTLDWETDGTPIGMPNQFFTGGVAGTTPDGELVIGGSAGFGLPGGIQFADPTPPATILGTIDPAGTQPFYNVIYNRVRDELIAIDGTFGIPFTAYATTRGVAPRPPENPCAVFDEINDQYQRILMEVGGATADLDADELPDEAALRLVLAIACRRQNRPPEAATLNAYDLNLQIFDTETTAFTDFREAIAALMLISDAMESALRSLFGLTGDYQVVSCGTLRPLRDCLPETNNLDELKVVLKAPNEPYAADGDVDADGFTNLEEWNNIQAEGLGIPEFVAAAIDPDFDGSNAIFGQGSGGGGGCFIATAAFGTPFESQLTTLRSFRDSRLLGHAFGAWFVDSYYRISPAVAKSVARSDALAATVRTTLTPVVAIVNRPSHATNVASLIFVCFGAASIVWYRCRKMPKRTE